MLNETFSMIFKHRDMFESKINPLGKSRKEGLKLKEGSLA